jgi:hypothetical protein
VHTNNLTLQDRQTLLETFQQFRAGDDENDGNYNNRDALENKLQQGGDLDELDVYMLQVAAANTVPDEQQYQHLIGILQ